MRMHRCVTLSLLLLLLHFPVSAQDEKAALEATIRHEDAAYNVAIGPRTVFEVTTPRARLSLSYRHRSRRWTVEGLDRGIERGPHLS